MLENWNPVADDFSCLRCCGLDDLAKLFESDPHFLGLGCEIAVNALHSHALSRRHIASRLGTRGDSLKLPCFQNYGGFDYFCLDGSSEK